MIGPDWKTLQVQSGKNRPHWSCRNAIYHVCFRLADSIPGEKAEQLQRKKEVIVNSSAYRNRKLTLDEKEWLRHLHTEELEKLLNAGYGNCYLRRPENCRDCKKPQRHGQLWQYEPYNRIIMDETEYFEQVEYVWNNPEKAGLSNCLRWRRGR